MLAQTPPLGWNSWNTFGANISEDLGVFEREFSTRVGTHDAAVLQIRPVKVG